jgi:hypothetical protein
LAVDIISISFNVSISLSLSISLSFSLSLSLSFYFLLVFSLYFGFSAVMGLLLCLLFLNSLRIFCNRYPF